MKLNFIFSNLNAIVLGIWVLFLIVVAVRFFRPTWVKNISFPRLILIAVGMNIFYGLFVTWGQYHVWATASDFTRVFINSPLSPKVPFPVYLNWFRPLFAHHFGYFLFYILGRVWLNILFLFLVSGALYSLFRVWNFYRGGFLEQGPELLLILMLISGMPGLFVSIFLGFIFSIFLFGFSYFKGNKIVNIEPAFIFATLFALLFTNIIFKFI
jgi:hypothetical protein